MNKLIPPPLVTLTDEHQVEIARLLFQRRQVTTWSRLGMKQADVPLFTKDEITAAIDKIKTKKAPDPDGIPTEAVKAIAECHPETCLAVLNQVLLKGVFPRENMSMAEHVKKITEKSVKAMGNLSRLIPNIGSPGERSRRILGSVADSIVIYGDIMPGKEKWKRKYTRKGFWDYKGGWL
nr:unnamed protein product [Callosobruchus analis]